MSNSSFEHKTTRVVETEICAPVSLSKGCTSVLSPELHGSVSSSDSMFSKSGVCELGMHGAAVVSATSVAYSLEELLGLSPERLRSLILLSRHFHFIRSVGIFASTSPPTSDLPPCSQGYR